MDFPFEKLLAPLKPKLEQLDEELSDPKVLADQKLYRKTTKRRADIEETLKTGKEYFKLLKNIGDNEQIIKEDPDSELAELARLWLWKGRPGSIPEDTIKDGTINLADFAELAGKWKK